ncbi:MAG: hypothetical protein IJ638_02315 [Alphaproteobacteria bacterium]|nr:hypothetical protein [Alphaproteobacteria bacterium]
MNDRDVSSYLLEGNSFTYYDRVYDYSPDENSGFITDIDYIFLSTEEDAPSCSPDNISINSLFDCDLYERSLGGISRDVFGECTKK